MASNHDIEDASTTPFIVKAEDTVKTSSSDSLWMVLLSTFVVVCGSFEYGCVAGYSAPTQAGITEDLGLTIAEFSVFGSAPTVGAMVGAVTSGSVADLIGRKGAMRISSIVCLAGWLVIYFAQGAMLLDVGRLITGYGMGLLSYVVPVFISEIAPKNLRGGLATMNQLMKITAVSFILIIGSVVSWRTLALVGAAPCFVQFFGLFLIPESPRWLAKVGHQREFEIALQKLRGKGVDISSEAKEIQDYVDSLQYLPKSKMADLFQRRYLLSLIIGVGLMLFQQLGGIKGIAFYVSHVFESAGFPSKIGTIIFACVQVPVTALGAALVDRAGRRFLLFVSASGLVLSSLLVGFAFFMKDHEIWLKCVPALALIGILAYIASYSMGMGAVPFVLMSELFPVNVKGTAGSLITLVNWFASLIVTISFNFLMSWSSSGIFFIYAAVNAAGIIFVVKLVPETKGRTLEEIQDSMKPL